MTLVPIVVQRCADAPQFTTASDVVRCDQCGERCWFSRVTQERIRRERADIRLMCSHCLPIHPADPRFETVGAMPVIPRAQRFFQPLGHVLVNCTICRQPAWADRGDVGFAAKCRLDLHYYCTDCVA